MGQGPGAIQRPDLSGRARSAPEADRRGTGSSPSATGHFWMARARRHGGGMGERRNGLGEEDDRTASRELLAPPSDHRGAARAVVPGSALAERAVALCVSLI